MATATVTGMGRKKKAEPSRSLRLPSSVVVRIRRIAAHLKKEPGDYAAERIMPLLDKDEKKMLEEIARERESGK